MTALVSVIPIVLLIVLMMGFKVSGYKSAIITLIVTVLIAVVSLDAGNVGGSIAHIGGAAVGAWFALSIRRGRDITHSLNAAIDAVVAFFNGRTLPRKPRRQPRDPRPATNNSSQSRRPSSAVSEEELDALLDKIKAAGYDALTDEERDKLFNVSRRK